MIHQIKPECTLCGQEKILLDPPAEHTCDLCGERFEADSTCGNGHFICFECRQKDARQHIFKHCLHSSETDVYALVLALMQLAPVLMHGPEHHFLLTAAMLTAHHNQTHAFSLEEALEEANRRSLMVPGGACGNWGICGATISAGIFASITAGASPFAEEEWKISGQLVSKCADAVSVQGGPRCCKRDTFLSMRTAVPYCNEHLHTSFTLPDHITCIFFSNNPECKRLGCEFFPARSAKRVSPDSSINP